MGVVAFALAAGSSTEQPDVNAIFDKARATWASGVYPREIAFDTTETVTRRSIVSSSHYHSVSDVRDGAVFGSSVSDEEMAHPVTPHGMAIRFVISGPGLPPYGLTLGAPEHTYDYVGVPRLSPAYSFGLCPEFSIVKPKQGGDLVAAIRSEAGEQPKATTVGDQMHVIATVSSKSRDYAALLVAVEAIDGHADYHLKLVPLRNPSVFRLREIWIRTDTYLTDRVVTHGNFVRAPFDGLDWTAQFQQIDGAQYLVSEETDRPFTVNGRHYDSARIEFRQIKVGAVSNLQRLSLFGYNPVNEPAPLVEPGR